MPYVLNTVPVGETGSVVLNYRTILEAVAATETGTDPLITVAGVLYERDSSGTDLTTGDGATWTRSPAGKQIHENRADFVTWAGKVTPAVGQVEFVGGVAYEYDGVSTAISDLPGWKPFGVIYVNNFGSNTTPGTTEMDAAFQAAVDYAVSVGGGTVWIKAGDYLLSDTVTVAGESVFIRGDGWGVVTIIRETDYGDTFLFTGDNDTGTLLARAGIHDLRIYAKTTMTSGANIHVNGVQKFYFSGIDQQDGAVHYQFSGAVQVFGDDFISTMPNLLASSVDDQIIMVCEDAARDGSNVQQYDHPACGGIFLTNYNLRGNTNTCYLKHAVKVSAADGIWFGTGHLGTSTATGSTVYFDTDGSAEGSDIGLMAFNNVTFDTCNGQHLLADGTTNRVKAASFANCKFRQNGAGAAIEVGTDTDIYVMQFDGCQITGSFEEAILTNSSNLEKLIIDGIAINGVNADSSDDTYSGIKLNAVGTAIISGGSVGGGPTQLSAGNQFATGIEVGSDVGHVVIGGGIDLSDNASEPFTVHASSDRKVKFGSVYSDRSRAVASATSIPYYPDIADLVRITGTTTIETIGEGADGATLTLKFNAALTVSEAGNIVLNSPLTTKAGTVLTLVCDSGTWREVSRAYDDNTGSYSATLASSGGGTPVALGTATYVRHGSTVIVTFPQATNLVTTGLSAGDLRVSLPFDADGASYGSSFHMSSMTTSNKTFALHSVDGESYAEIHDFATNNFTAVPVSEMTSGTTDIRGMSITYQTDS